MKLMINPKDLFRSKKNRSASLSFSSGTSSSNSSSSNLKAAEATTPKSVLPSPFKETSGYWSDLSAGIRYELVQAFKLIDKDGDGKITSRELLNLLSRLGAEPPTEHELLSILKDVDRDGDECIRLEEFGAIGPAFGPACRSEIRETFDFFDTDKDGMISAEELLEVFRAIGDERCTLAECQRMIGGVDTDGDGLVCFDDFSRMMQRER